MQEKIQSLNKKLLDFYLDDMEHRLVTDPLTLGGVVDIDMPEEIFKNNLL